MRRSWQTHVFLTLRFAIGVALLWYLFAAGNLEWTTLRGLVDRWWLSLAVMALMLVGLWCTSWRFAILLRPRGLDISVPASMRLTLIGVFFNNCLPGAGGGDVVRMYYGARGHEGRRAEIVTVMVLDRVTGMFGLILWPLLVAPFVRNLWADQVVLRTLLGGGLATLTAMTVAFALSWSRLFEVGGPVRRLLARLPGGALLDRVVDTVSSFRQCPVAVFQAVGISLLGHTLAMAGALAIAAAVNPDGFSWGMSILIPLGFMANAIPLTPGGLGVGEAAFDSLFRLGGLAGGAEVLLGWRFFILGIGLFGLVLYLRGRGEFVRAAPQRRLETGNLHATSLASEPHDRSVSSV